MFVKRMSAGSFFLWFEYWPIRLSEKCRPGGRAVSGRSIRNRPLLQRLPGIRAESAFFCAVCIFVPVFPLILGCKLSFLPVTKKGTFFCYQRKIRFLRGENILIFAAKKRYVKMRRKSRRKIKGKRRKTLYLNNVQYFSPLEHDRRVIVFLCIFCF